MADKNTGKNGTGEHFTGPGSAWRPADLGAPVTNTAAIVREKGVAAGAYDLWRLDGRKNPARQKGSRAAGEATALRMSKTQRRARAAAGGIALMHGGKGAYDPTHARLRARALQRLQSATRRGEHEPVKQHRNDRSRRNLAPP